MQHFEGIKIKVRRAWAKESVNLLLWRQNRVPLFDFLDLRTNRSLFDNPNENKLIRHPEYQYYRRPKDVDFYRLGYSHFFLPVFAAVPGRFGVFIVDITTREESKSNIQSRKLSSQPAHSEIN